MQIKGENMKITEQVIRGFRVAKLYKENTDRINNIDYSPSGDALISSSEDDQIVIYDCEKGTWVSMLILIALLHIDNTVFISQAKEDSQQQEIWCGPYSFHPC